MFTRRLYRLDRLVYGTRGNGDDFRRVVGPSMVRAAVLRLAGARVSLQPLASEAKRLSGRRFLRRRLTVADDEALARRLHHLGQQLRLIHARHHGVDAETLSKVSV